MSKYPERLALAALLLLGTGCGRVQDPLAELEMNSLNTLIKQSGDRYPGTRTISIRLLSPVEGVYQQGKVQYAVQAAGDEERRIDAAQLRWTEASYHALEAGLAVRDPLANQDPATRETVSVSVTSATDGASKPVILLETAPDSGVFRGSLALVRSYDERSGVPVDAGETRFAVNGDEDAVELKATYTARKGLLTATASYVELPMVFGQALTDDGTTALPGASIALERSGMPLQTTTARPDGSYAFYGLEPGAYTVKVSLDGNLIGQSKIVNLDEDAI